MNETPDLWWSPMEGLIQREGSSFYRLLSDECIGTELPDDAVQLAPVREGDTMKIAARYYLEPGNHTVVWRFPVDGSTPEVSCEAAPDCWVPSLCDEFADFQAEGIDPLAQSGIPGWVVR